MAYFVSRLGEVDKVKLMKLIYMADRDHFLRHGYPITGDRLSAMPFGPVSSESLNLLDGEYGDGRINVFNFIHIADNKVMFRGSPNVSLDESETSVLDDIISEWGRVPTWDVVNATHEFEEYKRTYVEDSSRPIPYELLLEVYGKNNENQYRLNRPVISPAMRQHMQCPFIPNSDADL